MKVAVIMGSSSDWKIMQESCNMLDYFEIPYEKQVVSAHRTPKMMVQFASEARERGIDIIIAGAGGAAHLPGMVASLTTLPVIGVPIETKSLKGLDSLLSIVQMPGGIRLQRLQLVQQVLKCRYTCSKNVKYSKVFFS